MKLIFIIFFGGGGRAKGKNLNGQTVRKGIVLDFLTMKYVTGNWKLVNGTFSKNNQIYTGT